MKKRKKKKRRFPFRTATNFTRRRSSPQVRRCKSLKPEQEEDSTRDLIPLTRVFLREKKEGFEQADWSEK